MTTVDMRSIREVSVFVGGLALGALLAFGIIGLVSLASKGWAAVLVLPVAFLCILVAAWCVGLFFKWHDARGGDR